MNKRLGGDLECLPADEQAPRAIEPARQARDDPAPRRRSKAFPWMPVRSTCRIAPASGGRCAGDGSLGIRSRGRQQRLRLLPQGVTQFPGMGAPILRRFPNNLVGGVATSPQVSVASTSPECDLYQAVSPASLVIAALPIRRRLLVSSWDLGLSALLGEAPGPHLGLAKREGIRLDTRVEKLDLE